MKENMNDEEKLELVNQMCEDTNAQNVMQMLRHEDEVSEVISSIEDADVKMRGIRQYNRMHEKYATMVFEDEFGIPTNDGKFNIEDTLDERFGHNIAKIAGTIDDDDIKLKLVSDFCLQMPDEDKRLILGTIKSDVKRTEAEARFNISLAPEDLASDEKARKASDEFEKEVIDYNTKGENESTIEEQ